MVNWLKYVNLFLITFILNKLTNFFKYIITTMNNKIIYSTSIDNTKNYHFANIHNGRVINFIEKQTNNIK